MEFDDARDSKCSPATFMRRIRGMARVIAFFVLRAVLGLPISILRKAQIKL